MNTCARSMNTVFICFYKTGFSECNLLRCFNKWQEKIIQPVPQINTISKNIYILVLDISKSCTEIGKNIHLQNLPVSAKSTRKITAADFIFI